MRQFKAVSRFLIRKKKELNVGEISESIASEIEPKNPENLNIDIDMNEMEPVCKTQSTVYSKVKLGNITSMIRAPVDGINSDKNLVKVLPKVQWQIWYVHYIVYFKSVRPKK